MTRKHILHMLTPLPQMSPFDVNMALDAGFDAVIPYTGVTLAEVTGLVQDAIETDRELGRHATSLSIPGQVRIYAPGSSAGEQNAEEVTPPRGPIRRAPWAARGTAPACAS